MTTTDRPNLPNPFSTDGTGRYPAEVPAWLNLDAIASPELRDELSGLAAHIEAKVDDLELDARRIQELLGRVETPNLPDDVRDVVFKHSGVDRLRETVHGIVDTLTDAIDKPGPWAFRERVEEVQP